MRCCSLECMLPGEILTVTAPVNSVSKQTGTARGIGRGSAMIIANRGSLAVDWSNITHLPAVS
jgi:hypothetical protein